MKKILLFLTALIMVFIFTACSQEEPYLEPPFPTIESLNAKIEAMGEVTDLDSATKVSKIMEEYQFLDEISREKVSDKIGDLAKSAAEFFPDEDSKLTVMSFNVRYAEFTEDRIDRVIKLILKEDCDIVGIQEDSPNWINVLVEGLSDKYEIVVDERFTGVGETGEGNTVLYKKDKFELLDTQALWTSDTPEVWSKYEDTEYYRTLTSQLLKRKSDGRIFLHVNTHLDGLIQQTQMLTSWIKKSFGCNFPVVLTGDFNCTAESIGYQAIIDAGYEVTNTYGENVRTSTSYSETGGGIIDFIFVSELFPTVSYKVCEEKMDGEWISDHNAIVSELVLLPAYDSIEIPEE